MEELLSLCLIAIATLLSLLFVKISTSKRKPKKNLPPGPWTLPIIGSHHHLLSSVPHRTMAELSRRHGPLMHLMLGQVPTVVVSSADVAAMVMKTNDLAVANRPQGETMDVISCSRQDIACSPYSDLWRQMRKICVVELLSTRQVKRMEHIRVEEVANLVRYITAASSTGAVINICAKMGQLTNAVVSRAVFGGKFEQQAEFLCALDKMFRLVGSFSLVDLFPSSRVARWLTNVERHIKRTCGCLHRIIADVIEERRAARAAGHHVSTTDHEDLLDVLLRLQQEDTLGFPLTTEIIGAILFDMFAAGTESSSTVLQWAMAELAINPEIMAKSQLEIREVLGEGATINSSSDIAGLPYLKMMIKEVLRLHPPTILIPRRVREDCKVMGYDLLKGSDLFINLFAVSRDPKYWENPEVFNPARFEKNNKDYYGTYFEFLPFGTGRRQCPAIMFSSSLIEMALANVLYHFDWIIPDDADSLSLDMSEKCGLTVAKRFDLQLRATPRACTRDTQPK